MNYTQAKEDYPKTIQAIKDFITTTRKEAIQAMREGGVDIPEDMPGEVLTDEQLEQLLAMSFEFQPRALFDFFDNKGIKISVTPHPEYDTLWLYYNTETKVSKTATTRMEADTSAVEAACILVERKLTTT